MEARRAYQESFLCPSNPLRLIISDHADWDGLTATITATNASEVWVTHGAEDALVHWCAMRQLRARPLHMVGYGDEDGDEDIGKSDKTSESGGEARA